MEMNKERETLPWLQELQALDPSVGTHVFPRFYQWIVTCWRIYRKLFVTPKWRASGQ
jgi:hypothetical protein